MTELAVDVTGIIGEMFCRFRVAVAEVREQAVCACIDYHVLYLQFACVPLQLCSKQLYSCTLSPHLSHGRAVAVLRYRKPVQSVEQ